jgi:hypothetical protein
MNGLKLFCTMVFYLCKLGDIWRSKTEEMLIESVRAGCLHILFRRKYHFNQITTFRDELLLPRPTVWHDLDVAVRVYSFTPDLFTNFTVH